MTNLEVFSLALQNGSLKEEDLLGRQTAITAERTGSALLPRLPATLTSDKLAYRNIYWNLGFCRAQFAK